MSTLSFLLRPSLALSSAALCVGCAGTLAPPPPVDVLNTAPPALTPQQVAGSQLPATGSLFRGGGYRPGAGTRAGARGGGQG